MKNTMKKTISGILAAVLTTACLLSLLPAAYAVEGEEYSIYNEGEYDTLSDGTTKVWKYRNLLPEDTETTVAKDTVGYVAFKKKTSENPNGAYVAAEKDYNDKKDGTYSWKMDLNTGCGMKAWIEPFTAGKYHISAWMKQNSNYEQVKFFCYTTYEASKDNTLRETDDINSVGGINIGNDWTRVSVDRVVNYGSAEGFIPQFRFGEADNNKTYTNNGESIYTAHIDDWSFSLIPSWNVNCTATESDTENHIGYVTWTFDKDIDKWTCTKDLFGASKGVTITDVKVTTDETTRRTTLKVFYKLDTDTLSGTITLPTGIKDGWGRAIIFGTDDEPMPKTLKVGYSNDYDSTEANELDAWSKWKYRNLLPEEGEDVLPSVSLKNSVRKGSSSTNESAKDTSVYHTGEYCWSDTREKNSFLKMTIDGGFVEGNYYASVWMKHNSSDAFPFYWVRNWTSDSSDAKEEAFKDGDGKSANDNGNKVNMQVTNEWNYYAGIRKHDGGSSSSTKSVNHTLMLALNKSGIDTAFTLYADDWSFRLIPDENTLKCEAIDVKRMKDDSGEFVRWVFASDVDKWTCTKDKFTAEGVTISDVKVTTDEVTRVTALDVYYTLNASSEEEPCITLPTGMTDAWGRTPSVDDDKGTFEGFEDNLHIDYDEDDGSFRADFSNYLSADPNNCFVFAAAYGTDGKLLRIVQGTVEGNKVTGTISKECASYIKVYVWTKDLKPLREAWQNDE